VACIIGIVIVTSISEWAESPRRLELEPTLGIVIVVLGRHNYDPTNNMWHNPLPGLQYVAYIIGIVIVTSISEWAGSPRLELEPTLA
jgi:sorbitol-specific phosphotransferase system component IIBC